MCVCVSVLVVLCMLCNINRHFDVALLRLRTSETMSVHLLTLNVQCSSVLALILFSFRICNLPCASELSLLLLPLLYTFDSSHNRTFVRATQWKMQFMPKRRWRDVVRLHVVARHFSWFVRTHCSTIHRRHCHSPNVQRIDAENAKRNGNCDRSEWPPSHLRFAKCILSVCAAIFDYVNRCEGAPLITDLTSVQLFRI